MVNNLLVLHNIITNINIIVLKITEVKKLGNITHR